MEEYEGAPHPPSRHPPAEVSEVKAKEDKEVTFWYSTGDATSSNTKDDIDMELISLDRFFAQVGHSCIFSASRLVLRTLGGLALCYCVAFRVLGAEVLL